MPVTRDEIDHGPVEEQPKVWVRVREEGHGKISTGEHDPRKGEVYYAEGETFETTLDIAKALKGDPTSKIVHERRYYVDILKSPPSDAKDKA